jgi:hypothetical protein
MMSSMRVMYATTKKKKDGKNGPRKQVAHRFQPLTGRCQHGRDADEYRHDPEERHREQVGKVIE